MNIALHHHKEGWYLCDQSYVDGKRRHLILEAYGKERPVLYPPTVETGVTEGITTGTRGEARFNLFPDG